MIQLHDIQVGYGHCVVAQFDGELAFAKAKLISIIGTNGSGKSTLLRAISSGQHIINGMVNINGNNWNHWETRERARLISVVLTERAFSYFLTVNELLELSRAPYTNYMGKLAHVDLDIINNVLTELDLIKLATRKVATLSDGQLQRVLIARALVQDTEYILMDEPTSHLDINHKADLLLLLRNYCHKNNKTIIYATHELQLAMSLCDEVLSIYKGQITHHTTLDFIEGNHLKKLFPTSNVSFEGGKVDFNFN